VNIVVDSSAIVAVIAKEPERTAILKLTRGARLVTPQSVHWEIGNAFAAMLKRRRLTLERAQEAVAVYRQIPIQLVEVALEDALALAARLGIYAYDAYIIACAMNHKSPLLALDGGLVYAARAAGVNVLEVAT
jgi:predicted nucleic acid-binding protein